MPKIESYAREVKTMVRYNVCPLCKTESPADMWVCTFDEDTDEPEKTLCPACKTWIKL